MTDNDKQALINNTATIETKIVVYNTDGSVEYTLTQDDAIKSWDYNDNRYVEDEGFIGQFVARTLDGELQNVSDDFNIQGKTIEMFLGIRRKVDGEFVTTYYSYGHFIVSNPEDDEVEDNTSFEAMDYTAKFNSVFNPDYISDNYPKSFNGLLADETVGKVTLLWLVQYVCEQVGIELATTDFRNYDKEITSNQFEAIDTCRDVIKEVAKVAMTWARIGCNDKLYLEFEVQNDSDDDYNTITNDNYYSLETQKDVYGPINKVSLGSSIVTGDNEYVQDDESVKELCVKELPIYDSIIANTQELRKYFVQAGTELFYFEYRPLTAETTGHPWIRNSDYITIVDMEGNYIGMYPFNINIKYSGHIRTTFEAPSMNDLEVTENYNGSSNSSVSTKYTRLILDRANAQITANVKDISDAKTNIADLQIDSTGFKSSISTLTGNVKDLQDEDKTLDGKISTISQTVSSIQNLFQITGGTNLIKNSAFRLKDDVWEFEVLDEDNNYHTPLGSGYDSSLLGQVVSSACIKLKNTKLKSKTDANNIRVNLKGTEHSFSYSYKMDKDVTATVKLIDINTNETIYEETLTQTSDITKKQFPRVPAEGEEQEKFITSNIDYRLEIETESTYTDRYLYIYDLMLNSGDVKNWEQSTGEISSTTVKMSEQGLEVFSKEKNIATSMGTDGFGVYTTDSDGNITGSAITEFDDEGLTTGIAKTEKVYTGYYVMEEMTFDGTEHHVEYFRK